MTKEQLSHITSIIKTKAKEFGFHNCGIAKAEFLPEDAKRLKSWLEKKKNAEMHYMENHFEKRCDPTKLYEGAKSVIVVLMNYYPEKQFKNTDYKISKYAYGTDYHFVIKRKLKDLISIINEYFPVANARAFVDSAPILERSWAQKAGLGWIGKNTNLITKEQGSFFFIGEIITDIELEYDKPFIPNHCGGCTRCIDACPTDALDSEGLNGNRCISFWTIEFKGETIPVQFSGKFDNWIFGCDICQDVCPWNRLSENHNEDEFRLSDQVRIMSKKNWQDLNKTDFNKLFKNSPIKRSRFEGLKRNIEFISVL